MRAEPEHIALVARKLADLGAGGWVRARGERAYVYIESVEKGFPYVRLKRTGARSWQLEERREGAAALRWMRMRGTRPGPLERLLSRWDDRHFTALDFRFDPRESAQRRDKQAERRRRATVLARDPEPLYALATRLTRKDARGLVGELRLAVERPDEYVARFADRLADRGIDRADDAPGSTLAWIALVDGLSARRQLAEVDWKEAGEDVLRYLRELHGRLLAKHDFLWLSRAELLPTDEFLRFADEMFAKDGVRLGVVDIGADCYPLVLYPSGEHDALKALAARCKKAGFGKLELFTGRKSNAKGRR